MSAVTTWIQTYADGGMDFAALMANLRTFDFHSPDYITLQGLELGTYLVAVDDHVYPEEGTWEEVTDAFDAGILGGDAYRTIMKTLFDAD